MKDEDSDEHIRKIVVAEMENFIRAHGWSDKIVQEALMEVAGNHIWRKGLWVRFKILATIVTATGAFGGLVFGVLSFLGIEVVRR
jgi:hypothetical protein